MAGFLARWFAGVTNAGRQGVQITEGRRKDSRDGNCWNRRAMGAVVAPALVFAPEAGVLLRRGGRPQRSRGNAPGAHRHRGLADIVTHPCSPFLSQHNPAPRLGGKARCTAGLSEAANFDTRAARFRAVQGVKGQFRARSIRPGGWGGIFKSSLPGDPEGHVAIVTDNDEGNLLFFEKNRTRDNRASWWTQTPPPPYYAEPFLGRTRPLEVSHHEGRQSECAEYV